MKHEFDEKMYRVTISNEFAGWQTMYYVPTFSRYGIQSHLFSLCANYQHLGLMIVNENIDNGLSFSVQGLKAATFLHIMAEEKVELNLEDQ